MCKAGTLSEPLLSSGLNTAENACRAAREPALSPKALLCSLAHRKLGWVDAHTISRDTAGQERFRTITTAYYRGAMGIMLVYDITNEKSFDNIKNWIRNIEEANVERMILGNKCDMNDKRQVSKERGEKLAIDYGIKFLETSAKSSLNVEEAFFTLGKDIMARLNRKITDNNPPGGGGSVKISENRSKKSSFFRCTLL
ncbi:hypothetical protein JZ751_019702 [Albula glossodonta]|uniref:small monomeric GTPase n=1 Tax=Albula glossodonta TaxID=121402 RepID=A0A8T2NQA0_9TELE|nr:hypothetical protein JZ751_019702 [Albula glossodonta]